MLDISNIGTCPANEVAIYIYPDAKLLFLGRKTLYEAAIPTWEKIPEHIEKIIIKANQFENVTYGNYKYLYSNSNLFLNPNSWNYRHVVNSIPEANKPVQVSLDAAGFLKIGIKGNLRHHHSKRLRAEGFFICPLLLKGEKARLKYECHANNLAYPNEGYLNIEGE